MPHRTPLLSIVIPVYNAEKYIAAAIDSIFSQSFTDYELILVNDGSSDHSLSILQQYAEMDGRVQVIDQANQGVVRARQAGLVQACGKYIHYMDADDTLYPDVYGDLLGKAESESLDMLFFAFSFDRVDTGMSMLSQPFPTVDVRPETVMKRCFELDYFAVWQYIHRRSLYDHPYLSDPLILYGEDLCQTIQLLYYAQKVGVYDPTTPMLHYRVYGESVSQSLDFTMQIDNLHRTMHLITTFFDNKPDAARFDEALSYYRLRFYAHLVRHGYLDEISKMAARALTIYMRYPQWQRKHALSTYYKLFRMVDLHPVLGHFFIWRYMQKGKIKRR